MSRNFMDHEQTDSNGPYTQADVEHDAEIKELRDSLANYDFEGALPIIEIEMWQAAAQSVTYARFSATKNEGVQIIV